MVLILLIFRSVITFTLMASFSLVFMELFLIAGILTTKIMRNVREETDEMKRLKDYTIIAFGGLVSGVVSLVAIAFL